MDIKVALVLVGIYLLIAESSARSTSADKYLYSSIREKFLEEESNLMLGSDIVLSSLEKKANQILMKAKYDEIDSAFTNPSQFLPSQNFLKVVDKIKESPVFKIIKKMPKGSVLHGHNKALASTDYIHKIITYYPHLYICESDGDMRMKFFDKPDKTCDWRLLSQVRKTDIDVENRIRNKLTMKVSNPELIYSNVDNAWDKFLTIFDFVAPILKFKVAYEDYLRQILYESYNDNILYLEMRASLSSLYDLDGTTYNLMEVAEITQNVVKKFIKHHPDFIGIKIIYAPQRKCNEIDFDNSLATAHELKKRFPDLIAGFDLVGQEEKGEPLVKFAEKLREAGKDVNLFFHAGETNWYGTSTDENLIDAVLLNTKRIGHGFALLKHPEVLKLVREKKIAIEVSPISNQVLTLVKDLRNHPAAALFANNYPVVVSNDDPGLWGAEGVSYDFYEAFVGIMSRGADLRALKKLALNSIEYSSMDKTQMKKAREIWNKRWDVFVTELVSDSLMTSKPRSITKFNGNCL